MSLSVWAVGTNLPETGWLIHFRHLCLTILEAGMSKIIVLADSLSGEGPDGCLLAVTSHGGRCHRAIWHLFYKDTNCAHEV